MTKIEKFASLVAEQIKANHYQSAKEHSIDFKMWDEQIGSRIGTVIKEGKKYTKVDVLLPQQSGKYMIDNETGEIYGIKAYGVVHKGHKYGTLDTIDQYYWGNYYPSKIN